MFSVKSEDFPSEKEGVMPAKDVRRALMYDLTFLNSMEGGGGLFALLV